MLHNDGSDIHMLHTASYMRCTNLILVNGMYSVIRKVGLIIYKV